MSEDNDKETSDKDVIESSNGQDEARAASKEREDTNLEQVDQADEVKPLVRIHVSEVDSDSRKNSDKSTKGDEVSEPSQPVSSEETPAKDPCPIPTTGSEDAANDSCPIPTTAEDAARDSCPIPTTGSEDAAKDSCLIPTTSSEDVDKGETNAKEQDEKIPLRTDQSDEAKPSESAVLDKSTGDAPDKKDLEVNDSKPSEQIPLAKASHPLKPLPDFDEGITVTKSEPRLPLLPPIGSKKTHPLQISDSVALSSQSATILHTSEKVNKGQAKAETGALKERKKEGESAVPQSKKKSVSSLRSSSGSSIAKSKRNGLSGSSLGPKSKSKESLKTAGSQSRSSTKSKSNDSLSNGASKRLTRSRESLKAASQVYSSPPSTKSVESVKKSDATGKSGHVSKTKEGSKVINDKDGKHSVAEGAADDSLTNTAKREALEDNKVEKVNEEKHTEVGETATATSVKKCDELAEKHPNETSTVVSESLPKDSVEKSETPAPTSESSSRETEIKEGGDHEASSSGNGEPSKPDIVDSSTVAKEEEKTLETLNESVEASPSMTDNNKTVKESTSDTSTPAQDNKNQMEDKATVTDTSKAIEVECSVSQQVNLNKPLTPDLLPKESKDLPSAEDEDKISLTSPTDFNCKLEIDKKTGQSEQSIVEAVENSREQQ